MIDHWPGVTHMLAILQTPEPWLGRLAASRGDSLLLLVLGLALVLVSLLVQGLSGLPNVEDREVSDSQPGTDSGRFANGKSLVGESK